MLRMSATIRTYLSISRPTERVEIRVRVDVGQQHVRTAEACQFVGIHGSHTQVGQQIEHAECAGLEVPPYRGPG